RKFSLDPRWICRFCDCLTRFWVRCCCLVHHETFARLCQRREVCRVANACVDCWIIASSEVSGFWLESLFVAAWALKKLGVEVRGSHIWPKAGQIWGTL